MFSHSIDGFIDVISQLNKKTVYNNILGNDFHLNLIPQLCCGWVFRRNF